MLAREFNEIMDAAALVINAVLHEGAAKGYTDEWRHQSIDEHLKHIEAHITAHQCGDQNEDHLGHILCRAAMACALRQMRPVEHLRELPACALSGDEG